MQTCAKNAEFVDLDARGVPTLDICWPCADKGGRLRPDLAAEGLEGARIMLARFRAGSACLEDPTFKQEMVFAIERENEDGEASRFMPSSDVLNLTSYGLRITQPYALLSESEYTSLLDATPASIKLKPTSLPFLGPAQSSNFYVMDMQGLPSEVVNSCKKLEVFYTSQSRHNEWFLNQDQQLHQSQGDRVFQHIAQSAFQTRPEKTRPSAQILTLDQLRVKHRQAAAQAESNNAAAPPPAADDEENSGDDGASTAPAPKAKSRAFGIVVPRAKPAPKASRKAKAKAAAAAAAAATTVTASAPTPAVATPAPEVGGSGGVPDEDKSESAAGKSQSKAALLARLDPDMKRVGEVHMRNHSNGSVRSLEALNAMQFLESPSKARAIALTSVQFSGPGSARVCLRWCYCYCY